MAVDVIPDQSEKLKQVLFINKRLAELRAKFSNIERERKIISDISNRDWERNYRSITYNTVLILSQRINILAQCLERLPNLCSVCNGNRSVDHSVSGQMARVCGMCKGTGLQANFKPKKGG